MMEVQELVDLTIDFLYDSRADLKCCTLVNKSWLPSAQHHLFSYFAIQNESDCQRLSTIIRTSFRISQLITHLAIALNAWDNDAYAALAKIQFTNLRKLSIYRFPSDSGLAAMQQLCSIPSITHISMLRHDDLVRQSSLFLRRTAPLGTLEISRRFHNDNYNKPMGPIPPSDTRCTIDCIDIHDNNNDRLRNTSQPQQLDSLLGVLDFSRLRRLVVYECGVARRFNDLLQHCTSISDLEIHGTIGNCPDIPPAATDKYPPQEIQAPSEGSCVSDRRRCLILPT
ncbi:hypothetical protein B0H19DRAFT_1076340 [Mycena capillaripes]|nr:hypothetical protein B0H19DRAFT_1076340 [Mycena capillaripes]